MERTGISRAEVLLRLLQGKENVPNKRKLQRVSASTSDDCSLRRYVHTWIYYDARREARRRAVS